MNSTRATVPSLSLADALKVMFAGAATVAPFAGAVRLTAGGMVVPELTRVLNDHIAVVVESDPSRSVALVRAFTDQ